MDEALHLQLARLGADAESGASELLPAVLDILRQAREAGRAAVAEAARAVCAAQPSMAPAWNAAAAALRDVDEPGALARFEYRVGRAGPALRRLAVDVLAGPTAGNGGLSPGRLRIATVSYSGSVRDALVGVAARTMLSVACAEGRPRLEGRRLATALSREGIDVALYTDAALAAALHGANAVLFGADAIGPGWFLNKCGTWQLAVAASTAGVPAYVLATRDKFVPLPLAGFLSIVEHDPREVWDAPPPGVRVGNPYFERVPLDWIAGIVTDAGLLGAGMVEEACRAAGSALTPAVVDTLRPSV